MAKRHLNNSTEKNNTNNEYLQETIESSVYSSNLNETFEPCIWARENCLINIDKRTLDMHYPHGVSEHGEFTLIGKTRSRLSASNRITDQIGQVKKSKSKLEICHLNKVYDLESFVLLKFSKLSCFSWNLADVSNETLNIPTYALRLGYDTITQSVIYAGRSLSQKNVKLVGRVTSADYHLLVAFKSEVKSDPKYEILCLKPSPETLKHLSRNTIRSLMLNENQNIKKLKFYLEPSLIGYVKYKSYLKSGSHLKQNQCLISKNGKYKLSLESDGRLLYFINEKRDYLFLYDKVECLWFNELKLVVCFKNLKSASFLTSFDHVNVIYKDSRMKLCNEGNLHLISPYQSSKIVIQFRDDIFTYWNSNEPKFDFVYFYQNNEECQMSLENKDNESLSSEDFSDSDDCSSSNESESDTDNLT